MRETLQRIRRRPHFAAFDAGNVGLRRLHPSSELRLRQPGGSSGLNQRPRESELLGERVVLGLVAGVLAPTAMEVGDLGHDVISLSSLARAREGSHRAV